VANSLNQQESRVVNILYDGALKVKGELIKQSQCRVDVVHIWCGVFLTKFNFVPAQYTEELTISKAIKHQEDRIYNIKRADKCSATYLDNVQNKKSTPLAIRKKTRKVQPERWLCIHHCDHGLKISDRRQITGASEARGYIVDE
jgi:hypothetical protein